MCETRDKAIAFSTNYFNTNGVYFQKTKMDGNAYCYQRRDAQQRFTSLKNI